MTAKDCRPKFWVPLVFLFLFWVFCGTANAAQTRVLQQTFGSASTEPSNVVDPYPLKEPQGVAVNTEAGSASEGDVYVADAGNNRVEKFGPGGEFLLMFGKEVNKTEVMLHGSEAKQDVCTAESLDECQPGVAGSTPGAFTTAQFIAVDNDPTSPSVGDVYVADTGDNLVSKFNSEGVLEEGWGVKGQLQGTTAANPSATGKGTLTKGSTLIESPEAKTGAFSVGEEVKAPGLSTGTTITSITTPAEALKEEEELGVPVTPGLGISQEATKTESASLTAYESFGVVAGIAVGSTGTLYVMNERALNTFNQVFEFEQSSNFTSEVALEKNVGTAGLAVNGEGDLFKVDTRGEMLEYGAAGGPARFFTPESAASGVLTFGAEGGLYFAGLAETLDHYEFNGKGEVVEPGNTLCAGEECNPSDSTAVGFLAAGVGVALNGDSFLSNAKEGSEYVYGPLVTVPSIEEPTEAIEVEPTSVRLNGNVNPGGLPVTECVFEYGESTSYGKTEPCTSLPGSGTSPVEVHADIKGLTPGVTYHFRLIVRNANDPSPKAVPDPGVDKEFETPPPPSVTAETASDLASSSATLNATINPNDLDTEWHFEYDTRPYLPGEAEHGAKTAVQVILAGDVPVPVSLSIAGLESETHYYWRAVASSEAGTTIGAGHTFIYAVLAEGLPDDRAYELVSPNHKNGSLIGDATTLFSPPTNIAVNGQRVIADAIQCFAGAGSCAAKQSNRVGSPYEFTRTAKGWVTTPLAPPATSYSEPTALEFEADSGTALFSIPTPPSDANDFYIEPEAGSFVDVGPNTPPEDGPHGLQVPAEHAFTANFSHFAWDADYAWGPLVPLEGHLVLPPGHAVYEYTPGASNRHLNVGVSGGYEKGANQNLISTCATTLGTSSFTDDSPGAMSADGRTVYFTSGGPCASGAFGEVPVDEVFARVDGEVGPEEAQKLGVSEAHTVAISEPEAPSPSPPGAYRGYQDCTSKPCVESTENPAVPAPANPHWHGAEFVGASEDGSKAFFESTQQLTDGATEDGDTADNAEKAGGCTLTEGPNGCSLYEYNFNENPVTKKPVGLVDASEGENGAVIQGGPRVQGVVAIAPDGSHAYFVAKGVLTTAERPGCSAEWAAVGRTSESRICKAEEDADNLYVYDTTTSRISFVAALLPSDEGEWETPGTNLQNSNVTPDGLYLVFLSHGELTPDDTSRSGAKQVFRYDAATGQLLRTSIGNDGFDDDGNRSTAGECIPFDVLTCAEDANIPAGAPQRSRSDETMSDDGSRVFFESPVALTARSLNDVTIANSGEHISEGTNMPLYAENVYEWEQEGHGTCPEGRVVGCVFLISDGRDVSVTASSNPACPNVSSVCLLGTDEKGDNLFFASEDRLTASDTNSEVDYYDARVCEPEHGDPCVAPPAPPARPCSGEECHGLPGGVPGVPLAPSATFNGAGNAAPTPSVATKSLTRAQKLASALHSCRKDKNKRKRATCEKQARAKYGPTKAKTKKAKKTSNKRRAR